MEIETSLNRAEQMLISRARQAECPIYGNLELLPLCNMNCDMCYVRLSGREMEARGRLRSAKEWLALAEQMRDAGVLYLQLTGGEPLLYPEFRSLYLGLKKMGMILTVNTNGTLMDEEWAAFFGANKPRRINISLYGIDDDAYSSLCHYPGGFQKTVDGIRRLRAYGVDVKLNVALTNANKDCIGRYFALSRELDAPVKIDTYLFPATRERERDFCRDSRPAPEEAAAVRLRVLQQEMGERAFRDYAAREAAYIDRLPESSEQPRRMGCLAGSCAFVINWQGMLRPCIMMNGPEVPVFQVGFEEGWRQIRAATHKILLPEKCGSCRLREICGVCAASAMVETKDESGAPAYLCRSAEATWKLLRAATER